MTRALVTGGSGFLGGALVEVLVRRGYKVRVLDNNWRGNADRLARVASDIEVHDGDVRDYAVVERATRGVDWVFHLAFVNGTRYFYERPDLVLDVGVKGAIHTVEAARACGARRYILASSSEVYQEPTRIPTPEDERLIIPDVHNPRFSYSGGKLISELVTLHILGAAGVERVVFRPHNVYGPDMGREHVIPDFILRLRELGACATGRRVQFPIQGTGQETRAFCYVDDAVDGIVVAAERGRDGAIYHVGVDEEITIADLAGRIGRVLDLDVEVMPGAARSGGTSRRCPDISRLRALGYAPRVSLEEGLRRTCEWYMAAMA